MGRGEEGSPGRHVAGIVGIAIIGFAGGLRGEKEDRQRVPPQLAEAGRPHHRLVRRETRQPARVPPRPNSCVHCSERYETA